MLLLNDLNMPPIYPVTTINNNQIKCPIPPPSTTTTLINIIFYTTVLLSIYN